MFSKFQSKGAVFSASELFKPSQRADSNCVDGKLTLKIIRILPLILLLLLFTFPLSSIRAAISSPQTIAASSNNQPTTYTYYLPFLANAYMQTAPTRSYTTFLAIQNTGTATANIQIQYYQDNHTDVNPPIPAPIGTCTTIALDAECIAPNPFATGNDGTGIITSDQPLNAIISEATPYGSTAYTAPTQLSTSPFVPFVSKNAFGDFSTQLVLYNPNNISALIDVKFFDLNGNFIAEAQNFAAPSNGTYILDQNISNVPDGFVGYAFVTAKSSFATNSDVAIAVQVLQRSPNTHFLTIANMPGSNGDRFVSPQSPIYVPTVFNQAFGSFVTGLNLVNSNPQPVTVTITYYDKDGTVINTAPFIIPASHGMSIYNGAANGNGLPSNGLPLGFYGSAVIDEQGGGQLPLSVVVNEVGGLTDNGMRQSGTYNAPYSGNSINHLPVMDNGGFGFTTGATILNLSTQTVTATIQYYNLDGSSTGNVQTFRIGAKASQPVYQGDLAQGLPNGFKGAAIVTEMSGPSNSLVVTTNVQSPDFFYTYTQPAL